MWYVMLSYVLIICDYCVTNRIWYVGVCNGKWTEMPKKSLYPWSFWEEWSRNLPEKKVGAIWRRHSLHSLHVDVLWEPPGQSGSSFQVQIFSQGANSEPYVSHRSIVDGWFGRLLLAPVQVATRLTKARDGCLNGGAQDPGRVDLCWYSDTTVLFVAGNSLVVLFHSVFSARPRRSMWVHHVLQGSSVCTSQWTAEMQLVFATMHTPCTEDPISLLAGGVSEQILFAWQLTFGWMSSNLYAIWEKEAATAVFVFKRCFCNRVWHWWLAYNRTTWHPFQNHAA